MAKAWTLKELTDRLKFLVGFNSNQTDQDFIGPATDVDLHFRDTLNEAYVDEVEEVVQNADPRYFYRVLQVTWPAASLQYTLPAGLRDANIIKMTDVTNNVIGEDIAISDRSEGGFVFWYDNETLQWGTVGPAAARTIDITFQADPKEMQLDSEVPELIPEKFRHLLVWSAGLKLRAIADEQVPPEWTRQRNAIRERLIKGLAMGRPIHSGGNAIRITDPEVVGSYPY